MTNRDIILGRIREALKIAAPYPTSHGENAPKVRPAADPLDEFTRSEFQSIGHTPHAHGLETPSPFPVSAQKWLPPVGTTMEQQIELFAKNAGDLKAEFHACADFAEAIQHVKNLAKADGWKKIGHHAGELTNAVAKGLGLAEVLTDKGYAVNDLESCDAGLTECEALVAQTGTVMVSAPSAGGRALSVLPPHHIVLARRSQMVPDLTAAIQRVQEKYKGKFPSMMSFISGPSRTGDIERILVLGAHGPKKLTILLLP